MKGKKHSLTKHHRLPTSIGGTNDDRNISHVPQNQHQSWHLLFTNHTAPTICAIINEKWLDPDYRFICIPTDKFREVKEYINSLT